MLESGVDGIMDVVMIMVSERIKRNEVAEDVENRGKPNAKSKSIRSSGISPPCMHSLKTTPERWQSSL